MDMAMIAHASTLKTRIPFLNIFDGFRTSHELTKVEIIADDIIRQMIKKKMSSVFPSAFMCPDNPLFVVLPKIRMYSFKAVRLRTNLPEDTGYC